MYKWLRRTVLALVVALAACSSSVESQMQKYLEFYYPSTGTFFYQIDFDWGSYMIDTGAAAAEELHPDSELYRGYITARASAETTPEGEKLYTYLVTPKGNVWITDSKDIPETKTRQEVIEEKTDYGTSTSTSTITSSSEPVIDYFLQNKEAWKKYGTLKTTDGTNYSLELENK